MTEISYVTGREPCALLAVSLGMFDVGFLIVDLKKWVQHGWHWLACPAVEPWYPHRTAGQARQRHPASRKQGGQSVFRPGWSGYGGEACVVGVLAEEAADGFVAVDAFDGFAQEVGDGENLGLGQNLLVGQRDRVGADDAG